MPLKQLSDLLVAVWREVGRCVDMADTTAAVARLLASRMPLEALFVRELDIERSRLETLAPVPTNSRARFDPDPTPCEPAQVKRFVAWCQRGEVAHHGGHRASEGDWALCLPRTTTCETLVGPLASGPMRHGVLLVLAHPRDRFDARHVVVMKALLDPFSSALQSHHRLRELTTLREAAEAEKQSLLSRLGRTEAGEAIVGVEAGLRHVMERVALVAKSDVPVLILGETGAGKEVVARAIHLRSTRGGGPFIRVNCGAIPPDLIDSHLFGHERGSFTGAIDTRKGWFERAHGGTLFLDEIGDLPLAAQVRLLRVLQDGYLERIGGREPLKVDTRLVTATHRDLTVMVREGRFREDLWYRIAVFPVLLPPLRDRREDIPELARHFAQRAAIRFGLPLQLPSPEDIATLAGYAWPGNIRELAAVIDRAAILGNGAGLEIAKALGTLEIPISLPSHSNVRIPPASGAGERLAPLDVAIRQHIEAALAVTQGRIEGPYGAARLLKVNPHTLRARMRRLGIRWGRFRSRPTSRWYPHGNFLPDTGVPPESGNRK